MRGAWRAALMAVGVVLGVPIAGAFTAPSEVIPEPAGMGLVEPLQALPDHVDSVLRSALEDPLGVVPTPPAPLLGDAVLADVLPDRLPPLPAPETPVAAGLPGLPRLDPLLAPPAPVLEALLAADRLAEPATSPAEPVVDRHGPPGWAPPVVMDWVFATGRGAAAAAESAGPAAPASPGVAGAVTGALAQVQALWDQASDPVQQMYAVPSPTLPRPLDQRVAAVPTVAANGGPAPVARDPPDLGPVEAAPPPPAVARSEARVGGAAPTTLATATAGSAAPASGDRDLLVAIGLAAALALLKPLAALYHRLAPARLLEQPTRRRIFEAIAAEPGVRIGTLQARLGLNYNTVLRHVRELERGGFVEAEPGGQRRWFAAGALAPAQRPAAVAASGRTARRILAHLQAHGPQDLAALPGALGVPRSTVGDALARLAAAGLVAADRSSGRVVVRAQRAAAATSAAPAPSGSPTRSRAA